MLATHMQLQKEVKSTAQLKKKYVSHNNSGESGAKS